MSAEKLERFAPHGAILMAVVGLAVRLLFVFVGARFYYGAGHEFIHHDSASYSESFINLLHHGIYSYDLTNPEAAFGRVPVYPLFWGVHYLAFGADYAHLAVAVSQSILDSISVYLVYQVAFRVSGRPLASFFCAFLYCFFPFVIIYVSLTQTETFGTFLCLTFFLLTFRERPHTWKSALGLGLLSGVALLTKEHLASLLLIAGLWFVLDVRTEPRATLRRGVALALGFLIAYAGWPIRNYVSYDRFLLTRSAGSGYARYTEDVNAFRNWMFAWNFDWSPYFEQITYADGPVRFPSQVFSSEEEEELAASLVEKARSCGTGFHVWKTKAQFEGEDCNRELAGGFSRLRSAYIERHPIRYATVVPLLNLKNVFFKSAARAHEKKPGLFKLVVQLMFGSRTVLLLAAFVGIAVYWRNRPYVCLVLFSSTIYLFFSVILRQTTFYYLVQADVSCLIAGGITLFTLASRLTGARRA